MVETNSKASIVECGIVVGKSFSALAYLAGKSGRNLYGFDTFEGFPEPGPNDSSPRSAKKGNGMFVHFKKQRSKLKHLELAI